MGAAGGGAPLGAGTMLNVAAAVTGSSAAYLAGSVVGGAGFGVAFLGGLRQLVVVIPDQRRAAVMSAFYIVAYASLSVPAVIAGVVVTHLRLKTTFEIFGSLVPGIALALAAETLRTPPDPRPSPLPH